MRLQDYDVQTNTDGARVLGLDKDNSAKLFAVVSLFAAAGFTTNMQVTNLINNLIANNTISTPNSVNTAIQTAVNNLLGGAGPAYDTLKELQDLITTDKTAITGLLTQVGNLNTAITNLQTQQTTNTSDISNLKSSKTSLALVHAITLAR